MKEKDLNALRVYQSQGVNHYPIKLELDNKESSKNVCYVARVTLEGMQHITVVFVWFHYAQLYSVVLMGRVHYKHVFSAFIAV